MSGSNVFLVNDDERGLRTDYEEWLENLAPHEPISRYRHNRTGKACPVHSLCSGCLAKPVEETTAPPI